MLKHKISRNFKCSLNLIKFFGIMKFEMGNSNLTFFRGIFLRRWLIFNLRRRAKTVITQIRTLRISSTSKKRSDNSIFWGFFFVEEHSRTPKFSLIKSHTKRTVRRCNSTPHAPHVPQTIATNNGTVLE